MEAQDQKMNSLNLKKTSVNEYQVCCYTRSLESASKHNPVLVLLHGYPQSSYMWRHLIPLLPSSSPIFVPDLPGYGNSPPFEKHDKLSVGTAILAALQTLLKRTSSSSEDLPVVLIGHDCGARIAHRMAVSGYQGLHILGIALIDIVPIVVQWRAFANPSESSHLFHWPFLANKDFATKMITGYGGGKFCEDTMLRWVGKNEQGLAVLKADDSLKVYSGFFENDITVAASCEEYAAASNIDFDAQLGDQNEGRKVAVPLLLIYSEDGLGQRHKVKQEWEEWVVDGVEITDVPLGNGIGHFGAEEAPKETADAINKWLGSVVVQ